MKVGLVTKVYKKNRTTLMTFEDGVISANCDVIVIFQFMANLEQFGRRIPDA